MLPTPDTAVATQERVRSLKLYSSNPTVRDNFTLNPVLGLSSLYDTPPTPTLSSPLRSTAKKRTNQENVWSFTPPSSPYVVKPQMDEQVSSREVRMTSVSNQLVFRLTLEMTGQNSYNVPGRRYKKYNLATTQRNHLLHNNNHSFNKNLLPKSSQQARGSFSPAQQQREV